MPYAKGSPKMYSRGFNDCPKCEKNYSYMIKRNGIVSVVCPNCGRVFPMGIPSYRYALRKWNSRDFDTENYTVEKLGYIAWFSDTSDNHQCVISLEDGNRYRDPKFSDRVVLNINNAQIILNVGTAYTIADWLNRWKLYHEERMNNQNRKEW